jgi:hypothetical protein
MFGAQYIPGVIQAGMGLYGAFGKHKNPANEANKYIDQISGRTSPYFDPYSQSGQRSNKTLEEQYNELLGNPGGKLNAIGENYQQSPGFKFALQQALQGAGHAAAAGGMAGSPQHEFENMQQATGLANQDYNNWLQQATKLYGKGLSGEEGMAERGLNAGKSQADMIAQQLAQQGAYGYQGARGENQSFGNGLENFAKGVYSFFNPTYNPYK